jgi:hypothetical protein
MNRTCKECCWSVPVKISHSPCDMRKVCPGWHNTDHILLGEVA